MPYTIKEHRHRFAVWAAARAAQRGLSDVNTLRNALEACGVVEDLDSTNEIDEKRFDGMALPCALDSIPAVTRTPTRAFILDAGASGAVWGSRERLPWPIVRAFEAFLGRLHLE